MQYNIFYIIETKNITSTHLIVNGHVVDSQVWRKTRMSHPWRWLETDKHVGGSGSSSRGLAEVSRMRTEDSNTVWLESWVERSICGSLLVQQRGGDSTRSRTRLFVYSGGFEQRCFLKADTNIFRMKQLILNSGFGVSPPMKCILWLGGKALISILTAAGASKISERRGEAKFLTHFVARKVSNPL